MNFKLGYEYVLLINHASPETVTPNPPAADEGSV
jgi:hypothetical protein